MHVGRRVDMYVVGPSMDKSLYENDVDPSMDKSLYKYVCRSLYEHDVGP